MSRTPTRNRRLGRGAAGALALGVLALAAGPALTQDGKADTLPLREVALFSSGVGYFERGGKVDGNVTVPLSFRAEQINDILKSLVLLDPGGTVRPVTYAAAEPISSRLSAAGKALDQSITLGALLRQFQGARVHLETGAVAVTGRIVSVSLKAVTVKEAVVQNEVVNVLTDTGLRAIPLDSVQEVRLLDERLDKELRRSLELLATGIDDTRRSVELKFSGNAAREIRAGYLQEMPVWKTSYRLVLGGKEKPYLQGWAMVENTTDEDWNNVRLSLISGRPISFLQDLYQPLYVPRPVVQAQVIGSPVPQTYGEILEEGTDRPVRSVRMMPKITDSANFGFRGAGPAGPPGPPGVTPGQMGGLGGGGFGASADEKKDAASRRKMMAMAVNELEGTVGEQAAGAERGDLFEYSIKQPLSLVRGKAAMVPIVSESVHVDEVSIFDADSDSKHALNGFRLKNTTGLHLSGGPITVFREGGYAGDAQIGNLQPGEDRLLSYAVDLELVADREEPKHVQTTTNITAKSGVLKITRNEQRVRTYTFRNKSGEVKQVLIQQNLDPAFKLTEPAMPLEKTPDEYRFKLTVPAGQTSSLKVVVERPVFEEIAVLNADLNLIQAYAQNAQAPEKVRAALKEFVTRRRRIVDLQGQIAAREGEIKSITAEQDRIRQNMAQLDRNSALYMQYVKKLTDQESRFEKLNEEIIRLKEGLHVANSELRAFVDTITD